MKKVLLAVSCILSFSGLYAQTFTSGHISATEMISKAHDSTLCSSTCSVFYNITIDSSWVGDTVYVVDTTTASLIGSPYVNTTGASPWTFSAPIYNSVFFDYNLSGVGGSAIFPGPVVKITSGHDTLGYITNFNTLPVTNPCIYSTVQGAVYADNNGDCIYDSGDVYIYPPPVNMSENLSSSVGTTGYCTEWTSVGSGQYTFQVQQSWMVNYSVFLPSYYAFIFPNSPCFSGSYTFTTLPQTGVDFPLQCSNNVDVQCYALSPATVRLDRSFYMQPYVSNTGCDSESGTLTLVLDSRVVYNPALSTYPADTVYGDTLIWNYYNLTNLTNGAYWNSFFSDINLTPDTSVVVGDTLCFSGHTNTPAADIDPMNNSFAFCLPVVYSYDPNIKQVTPKGTGPQGYIPGGHDTLTYNLQFQNTGTAPAINISVIDTLDSHINASSLRILGASFNMTPVWLAPGIVQFNFNNINLPDSGSNFAASFGDVRFKVALNTGLAAGTQIKNTGYIYFDANPAVVTNTVLNTIEPTTNIKPVIKTPAVKVYPNPATDNITVENLANGQISILNLDGQAVFTQSITNNKTTIDISSLPGGVYILKTVNDAGTGTTKFIKY